MRSAPALFLFTTILLTMSAVAQDPAAVSAAESACGPSDVKLEVRNDNSQHTVAQPEAGKALVYVIQDIGSVNCIAGCITTRIASDGAWVGANHHNSYFSFAVDPGEHHLCANWQSRFGRLSQIVGVAHLTAEAGRVYYFRTRVLGATSTNFFDIEPIDSDQGRLFVALIPLSVSHPKK